MRNKRMSLKVQARCCGTISSLLEAGFTLAQSLDFLAVQMPRQRERIAALQAELAAGTDVAAAFAEAGFAPVVCTQVALADEHGDLTGTLSEVAAYLNLLQESRSRVWQLLAYPLTLLVLLTVLQAGIVYWVLPQLTMHPAGAMLPQIALCVAIIAGVLIVYVFVRGMDASRRYHLLRHVPIVGGIMNRYYQYEFTIGAASFLNVGRDLGIYCEYLAAMRQGPLAELGQRVTTEVKRGSSLSTALDDQLVPAGLVQLVEMGQAPDLFASSVATYARGIFADLQVQMNRILAFVQPLMFLILGVQIVLMYARLLLPLYSVIGGY
ncbi:type II secretion system F family protein [Lacticaseibacillus zhaodongensis]|uniref:type II secretion system F family protein n=1 Tax=Lacticaseibacillus zhaodongensis TaxID=2668065 RepID=UPI0012D35B1F|nr:type II secretion system F family protein [Lacticaseibacillus zhaodongensis]